MSIFHQVGQIKKKENIFKSVWGALKIKQTDCRAVVLCIQKSGTRNYHSTYSKCARPSFLCLSNSIEALTSRLGKLLESQKPHYAGSKKQ